MARPKNSDRVRQYKRHVDASKRWRDDEGYDKLWKRLIDLYRGKQLSKEVDCDAAVVNLVFSTVNVIVPSVSVNDPKITVTARQGEYEAQAETTEAIVNYLWRHYKYQRPIQAAIRDSVILGHGWLKTGYRLVDDQKVAAADAGQDYTQPADGADTDPTGGMTPNNGEAAGGGDGLSDEVYNIDDAAAPAPTGAQTSRTDHAFVERVSPFDIYVDPNATSLDDMRWIAQRVVRPLQDAKNDPRYKASERKKLKAGNYRSSSSDASRPNERDKDDAAQFVEIWEFYDIACNHVCVFADGEDQDDFLIPPRPMPYGFGHPFVFVPDYEIPDFFYPIGEVEQIENIQYELNALRTDILNHRKRGARKYIGRADAFDKAGRAALESDRDNQIAWVKTAGPLTDLLTPVPVTQTPQDLYQTSAIIEEDLDKVSGISEYQRGQAGDIRRTATEASMIQDSTNARSAYKLGQVEEVMAEIANRVISLLQQYMTGVQTVPVVGVNGQKAWINYDRDYIKGEFLFEVEAGSSQPNNESFRRQSAMQMMDAVAPYLQFGVVNLPAMLSYLLQYGFGVKNPEQFVQEPTNPPVAPPPPGMGGPSGPPPQGMMPPGAGEGGPPPDQPTPDAGTVPAPPGPMGSEAIPPEILAQLAGQIGFNPQTMGQPVQ